MNKSKSHEIELTIPFHDLDPMNVVWHGNYLKYFDQARAALFKNMGVDLYNVRENKDYLFPVIRTSTKFISPLQLHDKILCKATLVNANIKIVVDFEIRLASNGKICARGRGEQVAVKTPEMELMYQIPEKIRQALGF